MNEVLIGVSFAVATIGAFLLVFIDRLIDTKYRILEHRNTVTDYLSYEVQKKHYFYRYWYNFNNVDGGTTGFYNTEVEAERAIEEFRSKNETRIIEVE